MSNRLNKQREAELEPKRMTFAKDKITVLGLEITYEDSNKFTFIYNDQAVTFFPYSGWHSGKGIKDGRGIHKLLKQLY